MNANSHNRLVVGSNPTERTISSRRSAWLISNFRKQMLKKTTIRALLTEILFGNKLVMILVS